MLFNFAVVSLASSALVAAHGKIASVQGDAGGNGTALGIQGGIVPGPGKNQVTEVDTTVFGSTKIATNGLGKTTGKGKNKVAMMKSAMALSGDTLPQVSSTGGFVTGTFHVVTTDGAGPIKAMIDPTGTGAFATGIKAKVSQQVPGHKGNIRPDGTVKSTKKNRSLFGRRGLEKRASNVNADFPMKIEVPAGTQCKGSVGGVQNVCLMKIANSNPAGPFGGVVAFQMVDGAAKAVNRREDEAAAEESDPADEIDFEIENEED